MKMKKIMSVFLLAVLALTALPMALSASADYVSESVDFEVVCDLDSVEAGGEFDVKIYAVNTADTPQKIESFDFVLDYSDGTAENTTVTYKNIVLADDFADETYVINNGAVSYIENLENGDEPAVIPANDSVLVATASFAVSEDATEAATATIGLDNAAICLVGDTEYNGYVPECTAAEIIVKAGASSVVYGDIDGDNSVTLGDISIFGKILAKWAGFNLPEDTGVLDLNADGKVSPLDLIYMARHVANWDEYKVLPVVKQFFDEP